MNDGRTHAPQEREAHHDHGPFTESKEVMGGFSILNVASMEEALQEARTFMELHRVHWPNWEGEIEIRRMYEEEDDVRATQIARVVSSNNERYSSVMRSWAASPARGRAGSCRSPSRLAIASHDRDPTAVAA